LQRDYTPPHIKSATFFALADEGMSVALAKRLMAKACLWLVRMRLEDIIKLHEVELINRYGFEGQGLDLVETAAIFACLPTGGFPNDPSGKKAAYVSRLEDNLKATLTAHDAGRLPQPKQRVPCYVGAQPLYKQRRSLLESMISSSTAAASALGGALRQSLSGVRDSLGHFRPSTDMSRASSSRVEFEMNVKPSLRRANQRASNSLERVDEIPAPAINRINPLHGLFTEEEEKEKGQRRASVKNQLEGIFAKRQSTNS
jgi:hypothetical protein